MIAKNFFPIWTLRSLFSIPKTNSRDKQRERTLSIVCLWFPYSARLKTRSQIPVWFNFTFSSCVMRWLLAWETIPNCLRGCELSLHAVIVVVVVARLVAAESFTLLSGCLLFSSARRQHHAHQPQRQTLRRAAQCGRKIWITRRVGSWLKIETGEVSYRGRCKQHTGSRSSRSQQPPREAKNRLWLCSGGFGGKKIVFRWSDCALDGRW